MTSDTERKPHIIQTNLSDEEWNAMFPSSSCRTPTQIGLRARQLLTIGARYIDSDESEKTDGNPVGEGGPFDFSKMNFSMMDQPLLIHFDTMRVTSIQNIPIWRVDLDDGRSVDILGPSDGSSFTEDCDRWMLFKHGDPNGESIIIMMIPFEIITSVTNLTMVKSARNV